MRLNATQFLLGCALAGLLAGCDSEPPPVAERVRPIRTFTVTEVASGQARKFSGVIQASDSSGLSFQVGGNVLEVNVNQGDRVTAGQVLAVLDQESFKLDVKAAEAEVDRARAAAAQSEAEYERQGTLHEQGWVARSRFDSAERAYRSALSRVSYTIARLDLARRDLRDTTLSAPFDGFISSKSIDPFVEVEAGQELFVIDAEGGFEAAIGVPETAIDQVLLGMPASVAFPQVATPIEALITEIGTAAGRGNTFPVKAALTEPPPFVRTGMTAEVTLVLSRQDVAEGRYMVPLSTIAPGEKPGEGFVFVYERETSTVRRTVVKLGGSLQGNVMPVSGVEIGNILASAGVNFLVDGQEVTLLEPVLAASGN